VLSRSGRQGEFVMLSIEGVQPNRIERMVVCGDMRESHKIRVCFWWCDVKQSMKVD